MAIQGASLQGENWKKIKSAYVQHLARHIGGPGEQGSFVSRLIGCHANMDALQPLLLEWLDQVINKTGAFLCNCAMSQEALDNHGRALEVILFTRSLVKQGDEKGKGRIIFSAFRRLGASLANENHGKPDESICQSYFKTQASRIASDVRYKFDAQILSSDVDRELLAQLELDGISETFVRSLARIDLLNNRFMQKIRQKSEEDILCLKRLAQLLWGEEAEPFEDYYTRLIDPRVRGKLLLYGESLLDPGNKPQLHTSKLGDIKNPDLVDKRLAVIADLSLFNTVPAGDELDASVLKQLREEEPEHWNRGIEHDLIQAAEQGASPWGDGHQECLNGARSPYPGKFIE